MMWRITVMGEGVNLRGTMDGERVADLAEALKPLDLMVIASPMPEEAE